MAKGKDIPLVTEDRRTDHGDHSADTKWHCPLGLDNGLGDHLALIGELDAIERIRRDGGGKWQSTNRGSRPGHDLLEPLDTENIDINGVRGDLSPLVS
jgi:hypothetical protein